MNSGEQLSSIRIGKDKNFFANMKYKKNVKAQYRYIRSIGKGNLVNGWKLYNDKYESLVGTLLTIELEYKNRRQFCIAIQEALDESNYIQYYKLLSSIESRNNLHYTRFKTLRKIIKGLKWKMLY